MNIHWKMSIVNYPSWQPSQLPKVLQKYHVLLKPDGVINGSPEHHLRGLIAPSPEVLGTITGYFNMFLELKMPFGQNSYVWPSYQEDYIRCPSNEAIDHFHCDL